METTHKLLYVDKRNLVRTMKASGHACKFYLNTSFL
jgi:hypothetical protein